MIDGVKEIVKNSIENGNGIYMIDGKGSRKTINAHNLTEIIMQIVTKIKKDNSWLSMMAKAFLASILPPLVLMRDLKLVIDPTELASVSTFKDLESKKKVKFNIRLLLNYLNFQAAIDLYYMMNRLLKDDDFIEATKAHNSYSSLQRGYAEDVIGKLGRNLLAHNIDITSAIAPVYAKLPSDIKKNHPKATEDLFEILTKLVQEY